MGARARGATLALLVFACGGEEPASAPAPDPTPAVRAGTVRDAAVPSEALFIETVERAQSCDMIIGGERRVERAMLQRGDEGLKVLEVVEERRIKLDCPAPEDMREGKIIAQLEAGPGGPSRQTDIVSWDVALEATAKPRVLKIEAAQEGLPPDLNEEDAAELWPELDEELYWEGEAAPAGEPELSDEPEEASDETKVSDEPKSKPKPVAALVEVRFNAGRLKWAELAYEDLASKRKKQVILGPSAMRKLPAGRYKLSVRYPETSASWQDAGELELEVGKQIVSIKMRETPSLRAQIVSAE